MKNKNTHQNYQHSKPLLIGFILIILITGYFLTKTWQTKNHLNELEQRLKDKNQKSQDIDIETVTPENVYQWINKPDIQLIDIRNKREYTIKHIESSINIPLDSIKKNIAEFNKDKQLIIIDREDTLEGKILVDHFKKEGLNIKYLKDGILRYAQENYPLVTNGDPTIKTNLLKIKPITAEEVKKELLTGKVFSFIDTRPSLSYNLNKIDGSTNAPLEKIEELKGTLPTHILLLYDTTPERSFKAGVKLYDMGISNFYVCTDTYEQLKQTLFNKQK